MAGNMLCAQMSGKVHPTIIMGAYFGGLALTLFLAAVICNLLKGYRSPTSDDYVKAIITVVVITLAAALFQLLYSIDINPPKIVNNKEFIFLIDDSGSMLTNDPDNQRYEAIKEVMAKSSSNSEFCVYSFSDYCVRGTDMIKAKDADSFSIDSSPAGMTNMETALEMALNDIKNGTIPCSSGAKLILLTDGYSTEDFNAIRVRNMLTEANELNVSISAVGFGDCDDVYLQNLADMTGGKYVRASNASELGKAMVVASQGESDYRRNIINHRNPISSWVEYLYGFERMLFIVLIGVAFIYLKSLLLHTSNGGSNLLVEHIIIVAIGALGIEIGMNMFYIKEWYMRLLMCVCFTLIYLTEEKKKAGKSSKTSRQVNYANKESTSDPYSSSSYDSDSGYDDIYN